MSELNGLIYQAIIDECQQLEQGEALANRIAEKAAQVFEQISAPMPATENLGLQYALTLSALFQLEEPLRKILKGEPVDLNKLKNEHFAIVMLKQSIIEEMPDFQQRMDAFANTLTKIMDSE